MFENQTVRLWIFTINFQIVLICLSVIPALVAQVPCLELIGLWSKISFSSLFWQNWHYTIINHLLRTPDSSMCISGAFHLLTRSRWISVNKYFLILFSNPVLSCHNLLAQWLCVSCHFNRFQKKNIMEGYIFFFREQEGREEVRCKDEEWYCNDFIGDVDKINIIKDVSLGLIRDPVTTVSGAKCVYYCRHLHKYLISL